MQFRFLSGTDSSITKSARLELAESLASGLSELDELILVYNTNYFDLELCTPRDSVATLIRVLERPYRKDIPIGQIAIETKTLYRHYLPTLIPIAEKAMKHSNASALTEQWKAMRNRTLGVAYVPNDGLRTNPADGWHFAPASALIELVLSYALVTGGVARISKQLAERSDRTPVYCACLSLSYLGPCGSQAQIERLYIPLEEIRRLAATRKAALLPNSEQTFPQPS